MALEAVTTREERFNRLYEEHFEAVRRYVWRREPSIADDVVAETFLVAWRRLDDLPVSARPWLIGVARNVRPNLRPGAGAPPPGRGTVARAAAPPAPAD